MTDPAAQTPQRRLLALLFADVVGYSRLMARDEAATLARLEECVGLFRRLIVDYGGRIVETPGDQVYAVFESAVQALRFAVEIQREFRNRQAWIVGQEPILFRIGIHSGEVLVTEDRVQGHHVNVTARIQTLAPAGGICISGVVQAVAAADTSFRTRSLGSQLLKNLPEPLELFVVDLDEPPDLSAFLLPPAPPPPPLWPTLGGQALPVPPQPRPRHETRLAVLRFDNLSQDPVDEHLCKGLAADVISNLTCFRDLAVIAPHSAFLFKEPVLTVPQIAERLGVAYLVEGSLQRIGHRLRLRVYLIDGATGDTVWSERYDGSMDDVFAFQDDMLGVIASRLAIQVTAAERRRLEERYIPYLEAYGLSLRGYDLSLRCRREATLHARRLFEEAAKLDPDYGRPYAGMSRTFNLAWRYRWADNPEACLDRAVELAMAAVEHDALDARGFAELGYAHLYRKEHSASLAAYGHAVELNPNDADILAEYGDALVYDGQPTHALGYIQRAIELNPFYPDLYYWLLADAHFTLGDYEATIATLLKMRDTSEAHRMLAASYAHLGDLAEARRHAAQVLVAHPQFKIEHWRNVPPYKDRQALERFVEGLRRAGLT